MRYSSKYSKTLLSLAIASLLPHGVAQAAVLEEVIVTAQKRAESVNDISISASAYGGDQLRNLGVDSATDLGAYTPGLVTVNSTSGGTPIFAIRGIGLDDFSPNNTSGVGVYLDEVFASSPAFLGGQLFDIDRVEVLKGPQGTLYGKNTTGGAINFISNMPSDEFEASVDLGISRYNTTEFTGVISGPIGNDVLGRLSVNVIGGDGWQKDINTGREYGSQERTAIRGILDFPLTENGTAVLKAYHSTDDSTPESPQVSGLGDFFEDPSFDILNSPDDASDVTVGDLKVDRNEEGSGISLRINYSFENFDLISISAIDKYERKVVDNYGGSSAAILDLYQDDEMEQWSQEFRFVSNSDGDFNWVAGFNISNEEVTVVDSFDDSLFVTDSVAVNFVLDPADVAVQGFDLLTADYKQITDSYGLYVHTETQIADTLTLIAGLRYSNDDRSFVGSSTNHDDVFSFNDVISSMDESREEDNFTGKIGLDWDATDELLIYGSFSNSYKSGAFYGAAILDDISWAYVEPEKVSAFEIGFKMTLLDGSMQLNGAAFTLDYEDRQSLVTIIVDDFSNFLEVPVADTTLINVPESTTQGIELDMQWLPTDSLTVMLGLSYLDTEVTKAPTSADMRGIEADASVNDLADGVSVAFVDALAAPLENGASLAQAPEWSYNGMLAYDIAVGSDLYLRLQTSYSYSDKMIAQLADANAISDSLSSWDAQVSLAGDDDRWRVSAWVKNIQDNDNISYSFSSFAGRSYYKQQPTTYGLTLHYALY